MRVRIVGCGSLGTALAEEAVALGWTLEVADIVDERARALSARVRARHVRSDAAFDGLDLLIEAAGQDAVRDVVPKALAAGVDCVVMTTGAFTWPGVLDAARRAMASSNAKLYLPSGGVAGLDAVKALAREPGARAVLTTRKPPGSLGLPEGTTGEQFRGPAAEAVARFPKNVNIAATLTLAGLAPEVRVVADPTVDRVVHEVVVTSPRVTVRVTVESDPSDANPATSQMALLSARALLRRLPDPVRVGT